MPALPDPSIMLLTAIARRHVDTGCVIASLSIRLVPGRLS